ncbi:MAG: Cell wall surface anchor family protein [Candidatus Falkowbacteria bacterium GW2011_GWF2_43_32]|nr:MAG: Cell wall surface anchor family protein [Candidatus Falkowbacteria bacterium GW2011_GWF2_43_32]
MKKIKSFIFSESKLAKAIFGFLVVAVFALVLGPNLYAQFMRQTGDSGWGYGYGYGYGYGSGFDGGTLYGYKTDFTTSAAGVYGYGFGYGYRASADSVAVGDVSYQEVPAASIAAAVPTLFTVAGGDPTATDSLTAADNIAFTATNADGDIQVLIPSGTVITNSDSTAFDATTLTSADRLSSITATTISSTATLKGAAEFGATGETLYFSAPITVKVPVSSSLNGTTLSLKRSADSGSTWATTGLAAASTDTCTAGVASNEASGVVVSDGYATIYTCRASYFAVYSAGSSSSSSSGGSSGIVSPVCTSVTYGDFAATCFAGYQYRNVLSSYPSNCTLTAAQQEATKKVCGATDPVTTPSTTSTTEVGMDSGLRNAFVAAEKGLVTRVNAALAKRLSGRILLQVQAHGEAWYVNPLNLAKYYLGRPADAFGIMRGLGLGVSEKDYSSWNGKAPSRLAGRILLLDLKLNYLGRPADAFAIMRNLGLGITNDNLRQISVEDVE